MHVPQVRLLLARGADADAVDAKKLSAVELAAGTGDLDTFAALYDGDGVMFAAEFGYSSLARALLERMPTLAASVAHAREALPRAIILAGPNQVVL